MDDDYWIYQDILIPKSIESVPAIDGYSTVYQNGVSFKHDQMLTAKPKRAYTTNEYRRLYATYNPENGNYYWRTGLSS